MRFLNWLFGKKKPEQKKDIADEVYNKIKDELKSSNVQHMDVYKKELAARKQREQETKKKNRKANLEAALKNLLIAERYQSRQMVPGISKTYSAELEAIIVARVETARSLGVNVITIDKSIDAIEKELNGD